VPAIDVHDAVFIYRLRDGMHQGCREGEGLTGGLTFSECAT
jgi:hypothetical protein